MPIMPPARTAAALSIVVACAALAGAQGRQPPPPKPDARSSQVLRVGVDLVQIDATVTDRRGRHVADLTAEDFVVLQDGRPQRISTFAYVRGPAASTAPNASPAAPAGPSRPIAPDQVRRTIAIIVDDLGLSFESMARARDAVRHFLDKQMQRGDLVAIIRTGAGSGALQQFTSDRRILDAAVERIRWNMMARVSAFLGPGDNDVTDAFRREVFSAGTLGAIEYIVRGVAALPGRKSVIVLSDGFRMLDTDGNSGRVLDGMHRLVDAANRAGVVIHAIDARGLVVTGPGAADTTPEQTDARREELAATQDGLGMLADETGGLFMRNQNDIPRGVERVLEDQQGYYLLGYVPERSTFGSARPRFHKLAVRVNRPDLRVRSRRGFLGRADDAPKPVTAASRMVSAVMSPFAGGDIRLRLSSYFGHDAKIGPVMLSVMHVNAGDLTFTAEADGTRSAQIEALAVTFDADGQVADQNSRSFTFRMPEEAYARALNRGFVYRIRVPLKRAGPYQLRIALRDVRGDRIGSASQFIEIPDVKKGRLALSGLVIDGSKQRARPEADNAVDHEDPGPTVALRTFRQGTDATYFCEIYNAQRGRDGKPQLESATRLFREGIEVFKSAPRVVELPDAKRPTVASGILRFLDNMMPGNYILEVTVTDRLAKKHSRVTQTIDFEVVPK
jgi:VWFA-related protein